MRLKINFLLAALLALVFIAPAHATDVFTWKPGKFKLFAGGVFGGKLATIIPISTLGQATTFTIPDPGSSAATFALQPVTSAQISPSLYQLAVVTLTPTQIKTLYSAPTQIIAAPGTGMSIVVHRALLRFLYTTPQYTSGGSVALQYDSTVHAGGVTPLSVVTSTPINAAASSDTIMNTIATTVTAAINKGIFASCATGDFATGSVSTITFYVWYSIE